jgi:hypothetical protein
MQRANRKNPQAHRESLRLHAALSAPAYPGRSGARGRWPYQDARVPQHLDWGGSRLPAAKGCDEPLRFSRGETATSRGWDFGFRAEGCTIELATTDAGAPLNRARISCRVPNSRSWQSRPSLRPPQFSAVLRRGIGQFAELCPRNELKRRPDSEAVRNMTPCCSRLQL